MEKIVSWSIITPKNLVYIKSDYKVGKYQFNALHIVEESETIEKKFSKTGEHPYAILSS